MSEEMKLFKIDKYFSIIIFEPNIHGPERYILINSKIVYILICRSKF